jgi:magnesium-transporting ATPase (P-type)
MLDLYLWGSFIFKIASSFLLLFLIFKTVFSRENRKWYIIGMIVFIAAMLTFSSAYRPKNTLPVTSTKEFYQRKPDKEIKEWKPLTRPESDYLNRLQEADKKL